MKPMPATLDEMKKEASDLGFFSNNRQEAAKIPRGKLIQCQYNSLMAGRSFKHVSILMLGLSGSGKSSTINHLFGVDIASTSENTSETRSTSEYIVTTDDPTLEVSNLTLGIIDTPGFNDTDGPAQDACNLLSINQFFKNQSTFDKCYPNIILLVIQATDTRLSGKNSNFYKSLKAFSKLGLIDKSKPNVVAVISFACSIPNKNVGKWNEKMEAKSTEIKKIIRETLMINANIVWIENNIEDNELTLTNDGQQSKLPDGTLQPKNLFLLIADLLKENSDDLGLMAVKRLFATSLNGKKKPAKGFSVLAKIAKSAALNAKETEIMNNLLRESTEGSQLPEVLTKINEYISKNISRLTEESRNELQQIGIELVEQLGLVTLKDIKEHSVGSLICLLKKELSQSGIQMLKETFDLDSNQKLPNTFMFVGNGYNILNDEIKPFVLFKMNEETLQDTSHGIKVPKGMELSKVQQSETFMEHFKEEGSYIRNRLIQLGVTADVDIGIFKMKSRGGFSRENSLKSSYTTTENSFLYEKRLFRVDIKDMETLILMDTFKNSVLSERLPHIYDKSIPDNRADFETFFNIWGHFVVTSAYGGGSVELKYCSIGSQSSEQQLSDVRANLETTFLNISGGFNMQRRSSDLSDHTNALNTSNLKWNGGDVKYQAATVNSACPEMWKKWETSLAANPSLLTTEMSLTPIYNIVNLVDPSKTSGCRNALHDLLGGKFTLFLKKEEENQRLKEEEERKKQEETNRKAIADNVQPDKQSCFPGDSLVWVRNKVGPTPVRHIKVGDEVLCSNSNQTKLVYSPVFMFGHKDEARVTAYLKIHTICGRNITISPKHLLQVQKNGKKEAEFIFADEVVIGDSVFTTANYNYKSFKMVCSKVVRIEKLISKSLYAPFTLSGTIVVDNILASCYANVPHVFLLGLTQVSNQYLAHVALAPLRAAYYFGFSGILDIPLGKDMPSCIERALHYLNPYLAI